MAWLPQAVKVVVLQWYRVVLLAVSEDSMLPSTRNRVAHPSLGAAAAPVKSSSRVCHQRARWRCCGTWENPRINVNDDRGFVLHKTWERAKFPTAIAISALLGSGARAEPFQPFRLPGMHAFPSLVSYRIVLLVEKAVVGRQVSYLRRYVHTSR
jgi:hypothetical protein